MAETPFLILGQAFANDVLQLANRISNGREYEIYPAFSAKFCDTRMNGALGADM